MAGREEKTVKLTIHAIVDADGYWEAAGKGDLRGSCSLDDMRKLIDLGGGGMPFGSGGLPRMQCLIEVVVPLPLGHPPVVYPGLLLKETSE